MKPGAECERLAELLREQANEIHDAELKAQYEYLVRSLLRLAREFEQDKYRIAPSPKRSNGCLISLVVDEAQAGYGVRVLKNPVPYRTPVHPRSVPVPYPYRTPVHLVSM